MVLNCVIHRLNIDHIDRIIAMAHELGAEYLELANSQYYSWAFENRDHLLPTSDQLRRAEEITNQWKEKLQGQMKIFFVVPDYHENRPKKCMNGWGNVFLTITPDGVALPCHTARMLPGLEFPNVRESSIRHIWHDSDGFNKYRGTGWMKEPCVSCDKREEDLGGCRCQAYMLTGDATNADPVCEKSPWHSKVADAVRDANEGKAPAKPIIFRR
jgi:pyrroloquinoline quinone biosynthesis protein E